MGQFGSRSYSKVLGRPMYLKLRDTGSDRPPHKGHVPKLREIEFLAKTHHSGMMSADIGAHVGCHTLLKAEAVAIRSSVREST